MALLRRCLILSLVVVVSMLAAPAVAHADSNRVYTRYDQAVVLAADGTAAVTMTVDLDFSQESGHGPVFTFITRMDVPGTNRYRIVELSGFAVTSPTGANVDVKTSRSSSTVTYQIGSSLHSYRDTQTYVVTYKVRGLVEPHQAVSGLDEFNWNAIGTAGDMRIVNPTVTLTGPVALSKTACFQGKTYATPCEATPDGVNAGFRATTLAAGEGLQVVAGFPAGTFVGAEPKYGEHLTVGKAFPATAANLGGAGVLALVGAWLIAAVKRRRGSDLVFAGVTPGNVPADPSSAVTRRGTSGPVAVAFAPPAGVSPGEAQVLQKAKSTSQTTSATLVDLAVRGYLTIEAAGDKDWLLRRTAKPDADLLGYEQQVLKAFFDEQTQVSTAEAAKSKTTGRELVKVDPMLTIQVVDARRWFRSNPYANKAAWAAVGAGMLAAGAGAGVGLAYVGLAWWGVALAALGLAVVAVAFTVSNRTATGSAVLAQVNGFDKYISTAEADQLKWEAGQDIYSAYLPWAMIFGQSERWTKLFAQLAEQGRYQPEVGWYVGPVSGPMFGQSLTGLADGIQSMVSSAGSYAASGASAGVGGGSGFSGGGGFGGGSASSW